MNTRKRQASEALLPTRSPKVPRTSYTNHHGSKASPTQNEGLVARWSRLGQDLGGLMFDTVRSVFKGLFEKERRDQIEALPSQQLPTPPGSEAEAPVAPPPPPPPQRTIPVTRPKVEAEQPVAGPSRLPEIRAPSAPSHITEVTVTSRTLAQNGSAITSRESGLKQTAVSTGLPSPPLTASSMGSRTPSAVLTGAYSELDEAIRAAERLEKLSKAKKVVGRRQHIYSKAHKTRIAAEREKVREELESELYQAKRASGYESDFQTFKGYMEYWQKLAELESQEYLSPSRSLRNLRESAQLQAPPRRHSMDELLARALWKARLTQLSAPPPKPFTPTLEQLRVLQKAKDAEIEKRLHPVIELPTELPPEVEDDVDRLLNKRGVIAKCGREQVSDRDISRLRPGQWLNDEIINFYGQMIISRAEESKENINGSISKGRRKPLSVHYFNTFFFAKLRQDGYEKARLAKWTKKIDIFSKDIILIPVNHGNAHWTAAAINFRKKRIEAYDSMGMDGTIVFKTLRGYLDAEHRDKKKKPFDFTGWTDYLMEDLPQQENGFDCGVFTCQFLEYLSRGEERFPFKQRHMPYLRRRMIWEIGHAKLRDEP